MERSFHEDLTGNWAVAVGKAKTMEKALMTLEGFFKAHLKASEAYAAATEKSAKMEMEGALQEAFESLVGAFRKRGTELNTMSEKIGTKLGELSSGLKTMKGNLAKLEKDSAAADKDLAAASAKAVAAKGKYEKTMKEADKIEDNWDKKSIDGKTLPAQLDKINAKFQSVMETAEADENAYKEAIDAYSAEQDKYGETYAGLLKELQSLCLDQSKMINGIIQFVLESEKEAADAVSGVFDEPKMALDTVDVEGDLDAFVEANEAQYERTDLEFEKYVSSFPAEHESKIGPTDPEANEAYQKVKSKKEAKEAADKEKREQKAAAAAAKKEAQAKAKAAKEEQRRIKAEEKAAEESRAAAAAAAEPPKEKAAAVATPAKAAPPAATGGRKQTAKATFDFEGEEEEELSFKVGDIIEVTSTDGAWWDGILNGKTGTFPHNYVELQTPVAVTDEKPPPAFEEKEKEEKEPEKEKEKEPEKEAASAAADDSKKCKVIFDFTADSEDDLGCAKGDMLTVLEVIDEGWLMCQDASGKKGMVPKPYVSSD